MSGAITIVAAFKATAAPLTLARVDRDVADPVDR